MLRRFSTWLLPALLMNFSSVGIRYVRFNLISASLASSLRRVGFKFGVSNGLHGRACGRQVSVDDPNDSAGVSEGVRNGPPGAGTDSSYESYF